MSTLPESVEATGQTQVSVEPKTPMSAKKGQQKTARISGVDLARALALMGMMAAHFGASTQYGQSFWDSLGAITHGRSSLLFAVVAGVSIALMTGRTQPVGGDNLVAARTKLVLRALFIALIGSGLVQYSSGIDIILPTYALLFVIAVPFLRAKRLTLILWAAGFATIGSALSFAFRPFGYSDVLPVPFASFLASSNYALLPWCALVLVGMAVGRTNLSSWKNLCVIAGSGAVIALLAYGSTEFFGPDFPANSKDMEPSSYSKNVGDEAGFDDSAEYADPFDSWIQSGAEGNEIATVNGVPASSIDYTGLMCEAQGSQEAMGRYLNCWSAAQSYDEPVWEDPSSDVWGQITSSFESFGDASPHIGTPAEVLGGIGISLAVIAVCVAVCARFGRVFAPVTAFGSMPLTIYTAHVLTFKHVREGSGVFEIDNWVFSVLGFMLFAWIWLRYFKRGPLESVMTWLIQRFLTPGPNDSLPNKAPAKATLLNPALGSAEEK